MTAGIPPLGPLGLLGLPIEILENILLLLWAQEILKLRIVMSFPFCGPRCWTPNIDCEFLPPSPPLVSCQLNRAFRDLIDDSPAVQYRMDLFSAALEDDPADTSLELADRRAHLEQYRSRWDRHDQAKQSSVELPPHTQRVIDGEVLACIQEAAGDKIDVTFVRLPSILKGIRRKQWVVKGLPKNTSDLKMYPALDMLVIPEILDGRWVVAVSALLCHVV